MWHHKYITNTFGCQLTKLLSKIQRLLIIVWCKIKQHHTVLHFDVCVFNCKWVQLSQHDKIQLLYQNCSLESSSSLLSQVDGGHLSALISFLNLWAKLPHYPTKNYSAIEVLGLGFGWGKKILLRPHQFSSLSASNKKTKPTFWPESMSCAW